MEFNKSVSNPMLMGCIQLLKAEDSQEHRNMFAEELLRSSFLAPAIMEPAPMKDADGKLAIVQGSKIQFPMLMTQDGKRYFMGFTDAVEYRKWVEKNEDLPYFALQFDDYIRLLQPDAQGNESPMLGFVVNPMGDNVIVPKEMVLAIAAAKAGQFNLK